MRSVRSASDGWIGRRRYSDFLVPLRRAAVVLRCCRTAEEPKGLLSGGLSRQLKRQGQAPERHSQQPCSVVAANQNLEHCMPISLLLIQRAVAVCKLTPAAAAIRHFATHPYRPCNSIPLARGRRAHAFQVSLLPCFTCMQPTTEAALEIISEDSSRRHDALVHQLKRSTELRSLLRCTALMGECVMAESHIDCKVLHDLGGSRSTGRDTSTKDIRPYKSVASAAKRGPERTLLPQTTWHHVFFV
jgi:hypothetical protein